MDFNNSDAKASNDPEALKKRINELDEKCRIYEKQIKHLERVEKRYEFIVNAYGEFMSLINRDYVYENVNDKYCEIHNKTREDIIGMKVEELWGERIFNNVIKENLDKCFKGETIQLETSFVFAKDEQKYYEVNYYPYYNKKGDVTHVVAVTRDIMEKKMAEIKLKESNRLKDEYLRIINSDLERAGKYVMTILPSPITQGALQAYWEYFPSSHLGGDSFGYHWIDEDHFSFYLLDVSGHGVGASLHSISVLSMLRFRMLPDADFYSPKSVLSVLNKTFLMKNHFHMYFTMWYCVINVRKREMKCAGAGHPPLLIYNDSGELRKIKSMNFFVGGVEDYEFKDEIIKIEPDSRIYTYTDGAYEIRKKDGSMMSVDDLAEFLKNNNEPDHNEMYHLYQNLREEQNSKLDDDLAILKIVV